MGRYNSVSDDYYVNMNLNTEMELPQSRETVLHFFEQVKKSYPSMKNFYSRERGEFVLEEDKDKGEYRWASIENRRVCSGYVNPPNPEEALAQHAMILDLVPYTLSMSPLDCESLNVMYGFDFNFRGNHNQLLADALGILPAFERMTHMPGATILAAEPSIQFALDEECRAFDRRALIADNQTRPFKPKRRAPRLRRCGHGQTHRSQDQEIDQQIRQPSWR